MGIDIYKVYKSVVVTNKENAKGNIVCYMHYKANNVKATVI